MQHLHNVKKMREPITVISWSNAAHHNQVRAKAGLHLVQRNQIDQRLTKFVSWFQYEEKKKQFIAECVQNSLQQWSGAKHQHKDEANR